MKRLFLIALISVVMLSGCIGGDDATSSGIDWELSIEGDVESELVLSFDEILAMEPQTKAATLVKTTGTEETNTWTGVPLDDIMDMVGVEDGVERVIVSASDGYTVTLEIDELEDGMVAYEIDGERLPEEEALRLVLPNKWGPAWIRGLAYIRFTTVDDKLQVFGEVKAPLLLTASDLESYTPTTVSVDGAEYAGANISALLGEARYIYSSTVLAVLYDEGEVVASLRDVLENGSSIAFAADGNFSAVIEVDGALVVVDNVYAIEVRA